MESELEKKLRKREKALKKREKALAEREKALVHKGAGGSSLVAPPVADSKRQQIADLLTVIDDLKYLNSELERALHDARERNRDLSEELKCAREDHSIETNDMRRLIIDVRKVMDEYC